MAGGWPSVTIPDLEAAALLSLKACSASASAPLMLSSSSLLPTSSPLPAPMMFAAVTTCKGSSLCGRSQSLDPT